MGRSLPYTTKEAAQRLGISMRRVNALIASGDLEAQRFGRSWMLDERSVHERSRGGRTAGRPKMNEKNERNLAPFTLMNRNHPVLDFVYNRRTRETAGISRAARRNRLKPLGIGLRERTPNRYDLAAWIASRPFPICVRTSPPCCASWQPGHGIDLMSDSWGLNLSDQYWFKPVDIDVDWHDVNYSKTVTKQRWAKPARRLCPCRNLDRPHNPLARHRHAWHAVEDMDSP